LILNRAPDATALRFGGLSGMVSLGDGRELLAISDDSESPRVLRLRVTDTPAWSLQQLGSIRLQPDDNAPARLDPEGIALTAEGHILISSEGISTAAVRLPPSITEYSPDGAYVRQLPVRARFVQNPVGTLTTGVRPNAGFESLTTTPDFAQLFTAAELSLLQDGDGDPFSTAPRTRMLEYVQRGGTYHPAREFVYELDPLPRPAFRSGFAVNGLVELLALSQSELLALERAFVESQDKSATINRIRLFRISLDGATDVSGVDALSSAGRTTPVSKVLLSDLNELRGLSPRLANLDNFEGLAWGPRDANGVRPLIVVSDDNFNASQVTAFLFLQPGRAASVR
jgi:3-phytase